MGFKSHRVVIIYLSIEHLEINKFKLKINNANIYRKREKSTVIDCLLDSQITFLFVLRYYIYFYPNMIIIQISLSG